MKALVYTNPFEIQHLLQNDPVPADDEVVVDIRAAGICGSDMHAFHGHDSRRIPPLILGHEAAGICMSGKYADKAVVINPLISCGSCEYCGQGRFNLCPNRTMLGMTRPGTFAQRAAIPERNLFPLPEGMSLTHAALTEPAATAVHGLALAARALVRPISEARALVIGGGSVGLLSVLLLKAHGCVDAILSEPNQLRREGARRAGIMQLHDPAAEPIEEARFDLVVDAVGSSKTRATAMRALMPGGVLLSMGLQEPGGEIDARKLTLGEITLVGTYTYTPADIRAAIHALSSGQLGGLEWVETRPLSAGPDAFRDLDNGQVAAAKVVLVPDPS